MKKLGLCSVVCARLGARVVATDGAEAALDSLRRNAAANLPGPEPGSEPGSGPASGCLEVRALAWGDRAAVSALAAELGGAADAVLMADVPYASNRAAWPDLVQTVLDLTAPAAPAAGTDGAESIDGARRPVVLWAHAARDDASRFESPAFQAELLAPLRRSFILQQVPASDLHPAYADSNVRVFVLQRR